MSKETTRNLNSFLVKENQRLGILPIRYMDKKSYVGRINEFTQVCQTFHGLLDLPEQDLSERGYDAVAWLKHVLDGATLPSLDQFLEIQSDNDITIDEELRRLEAVGGTMTDIHVNENVKNIIFSPAYVNDPKKLLTYSLMRGSAIILREYSKNPGVPNNAYQALKEVIEKDFPDSLMAEDLGVSSSQKESKPVQSPIQVMPAVALASTGYVSELTHAEDAIAEGGIADPQGRFQYEFTIEGASADVPKAEELPLYSGVFELDSLLGDYPLVLGISERLVGCELSPLWWNPANLFPLVLDYASNAQKSFATDFYDLIVDPSGSLLFDDLARREKSAAGVEDVVDTIYDVINGNSPDSKAWWIFAPEVYKELIDRQIPDIEAIQRVMLLARNGDGFGNKVTMDGFSFLPDGMMYKLSRDPNGKSYGFTRLHAKTIADLLLSEDKFDPDKAFLQ